jgi:tetratricopeptide (TPR) repeat protein
MHLRSGPAIPTVLVLAFLLAAPVQALAQAPAVEEDVIEVEAVKPPDFFFGLLGEARRERSRGEPTSAFLALARILTEGSDIEAYYQEAEYEISLALFDMGLFQSALSYIERIVEAGPRHPRYRDTLQWLVRLHRRVPGNLSVLERIAAFPPDLYPEALLDEINYYVGRYRYDDLDLDGAVERLRLVRRNNAANFIRARYLMGVIFVQLERAREAERAFKDVLRTFATGGDPGGMGRFRDLATMALARMFFTVGNYGAAERFYQRIPQESENWLDALYELSWTYFHEGNYARSMGNLWTLDSPYFEDQYFPEAKLLQATILYATCSDRQVIALVDKFVPEFQALKKEVQTILARTQDPSEFYFYLARLAATESSKLSIEIRRLFNAALSNRRMRRYFDFLLQLNEEVKKVQALAKLTLAKSVVMRLLHDISSFRELMIAEAGDLARQRMDRVRKHVSNMLADSLRLKFETIRRMRSRIEKGKAPELAQSERMDITSDDEHVLYDFDGEYWRDELGSYLYRVRDRCKK